MAKSKKDRLRKLARIWPERGINLSALRWILGNLQIQQSA
jgi:hypothetical protein